MPEKGRDLNFSQYKHQICYWECRNEILLSPSLNKKSDRLAGWQILAHFVTVDLEKNMVEHLIFLCKIYNGPPHAVYGKMRFWVFWIENTFYLYFNKKKYITHGDIGIIMKKKNVCSYIVKHKQNGLKHFLSFFIQYYHVGIGRKHI